MKITILFPVVFELYSDAVDVEDFLKVDIPSCRFIGRIRSYFSCPCTCVNEPIYCIAGSIDMTCDTSWAGGYFRTLLCILFLR
jgi:hypothetical protein